MVKRDPIYYIVSNYSCMVFSRDSSKEIKSLGGFLNELATKQLFSLKGYRRSVAKILSIKRYVPIYISEDCILFPVSSDKDKYYINYVPIIGVYGQLKATIVFAGGMELKLNINISFIKKQIQKIEKIREYKQSLFL